MNKDRAVRVTQRRGQLRRQAPGATVDLGAACVVVGDVDGSGGRIARDHQLVQAAGNVQRRKGVRRHVGVCASRRNLAHLVGHKGRVAAGHVGQRDAQDTSGREQVQRRHTVAGAVSQSRNAPVVCLRNVAGDGLGAGDDDIGARQRVRACRQGQRSADVVAVEPKRGSRAFGAVDVLLRPAIPVAQRTATDDIVGDGSRVLQPVRGLDLVHRGGSRDGRGRVLEVGVLQALGHEQAAVGGGRVGRGLDDHQVLNHVGRASRNRAGRGGERDAGIAADGADLIPSRDRIGIGRAKADAASDRQAGQPCGATARDRRSADAHRAVAVVLQNGAQATDSVNSGGRERDRDRADEGIGVGAGHPRPELHAPGGRSGCHVRPENPEQVVGDLHRMHELAGNGQRGLSEVGNACRAWTYELIYFTTTNVVLTCVLASVDLGGVISSAYCNLS